MEDNLSSSYEEMRFYVSDKEIIYNIRSDYVRIDRSKINR